MSDTHAADKSVTEHSPVDATAGAGTFDDRAVRALTESMTVLPASLETDLDTDQYRVYRPDGAYDVDMVAETCDCPDALHRGARCKHQRRVDYATGQITIPGWVNLDAVDDALGINCEGGPVVAAADGGDEGQFEEFTPRE